MLSGARTSRYRAKAGHTDDQAVTAVKLRSGVSGVAYEVVCGIPHADLTTYADQECAKESPAGVKNILEALEVTVNKECPVRSAEMFDTMFYNSGVWRQPF